MKVKGFNNKTYFWKPKLIKWEAKSKSKLQKDCKDILALFWKLDVVGEEQNVPSSKMHFDFVNFSKRIIVEADGEQHRKYNKFFHNKNIFNFVDSMKRDELKEKFAKENNFILIRIKSANELNRALLELTK